jgi:hypothetical protein
MAAFDQASGELLWKNHDFQTSYSSPILINFAGKDQLVLCTRSGVLCVDPTNGNRLWHYAAEGSSVTPAWNGRDLLFWSSGFSDAVGHALKLTRREGQTFPEELWSSNKVRMPQPTPVLLGDYLYGGTEQGLVACDIRTGKRAWVKRGFPMAACVHADGKLIILDQNGKLTLATASPEDLTVLSQCTVAERYSFTVPTLVGTTLYVRDRKHIMALDIGK